MNKHITFMLLFVMFFIGFHVSAQTPKYDFLEGKRYAILMIEEIAAQARLGLQGANTVDVIIKDGEWKVKKVLGIGQDSTGAFKKGQILEIKKLSIEPTTVFIRLRSLEPMAFGASRSHHRIHQSDLNFKFKKRQTYDEMKAAIEKYVTLYATLEEAKEALDKVESVEIKIGMAIEEVESLLGQPIKKAILGDKILYKYKDWKITFEDGKVSDVDF